MSASQEYLAAPCRSEEVDPDDGLPPFKPDANDHISLSMVDSSLGGDEERQSSESLTRLPPIYRTRSARSDKSGSSAPAGHLKLGSEDDLYVDGQKLTRRKSTPAHSLRRTRQHSSEALKYNSPAYSDSDGLGIPILGDEGYQTSPQSEGFHFEANNELTKNCNRLTDTSEPESASDDTFGADTTTFQDFDCDTQVMTDSTHKLEVPLSIRLRRASEQYRSQVLSRLHSKTEHHPKSDTSPISKLAPVILHKSSVAGAAVTHTNVNSFRSEFANVPIKSQEGAIKLNATLQIVQSRDSIYEIIWEDNPSSVAPQPDEESGHNVSHGRTARSQNPVETKVAAWAWSSPFSSESQGEIVFVLPTTSKSSEHITPTDHDPEQIDSIKQSREVQQKPPKIQRNPSEIQRNDDVVLPFHRRRASTSDGRLSPQQRQHLLGHRRLSNLDPDDEHFCTHRDSLLLAHRRIFQDDGGDPSKINLQTKELIDPHILQLRQATWTQSEQSSVKEEVDNVVSFTSQQAAPEYSPCDVIVGSSYRTAVHEGEIDKAEKRLYTLTKESDHEDEHDHSQCLR